MQGFYWFIRVFLAFVLPISWCFTRIYKGLSVFQEPLNILPMIVKMIVADKENDRSVFDNLSIDEKTYTEKKKDNHKIIMINTKKVFLIIFHKNKNILLLFNGFYTIIYH